MSRTLSAVYGGNVELNAASVAVGDAVGRDTVLEVSDPVVGEAVGAGIIAGDLVGRDTVLGVSDGEMAVGEAVGEGLSAGDLVGRDTVLDASDVELAVGEALGFEAVGLKGVLVVPDEAEEGLGLDDPNTAPTMTTSTTSTVPAASHLARRERQQARSFSPNVFASPGFAVASTPSASELNVSTRSVSSESPNLMLWLLTGVAPPSPVSLNLAWSLGLRPLPLRSTPLGMRVADVGSVRTLPVSELV